MQDFKENKAQVVLEFDYVAASVRPFKWDEMSKHVLSRMREEWADTLDELPIAEVKRAISGVLEDYAAAGIRGRMPCRFEVRNKALDYRKKAIHRAAPGPQEPEPPRTPPTDAQKAKADALVAQFTKAATAPRNHSEAINQGDDK